VREEAWRRDEVYMCACVCVCVCVSLAELRMMDGGMWGKAKEVFNGWLGWMYGWMVIDSGWMYDDGLGGWMDDGTDWSTGLVVLEY